MKSGVSGWQNLYLEHIGSDRRIFSEEVDPKRSPTHHRGPCEVLSSKSSLGRRISIRGAFGVPCGGGWNSGGRCRKTPDFGLVEGSRCPLKACTNTQSCMRMPHDGACHVTGPPVPFLRNGARGKTKHRERSGERTGNRPDRKSGNALRMPRHLDSSLPLAIPSLAQALLRSRIFNLRL